MSWHITEHTTDNAWWWNVSLCGTTCGGWPGRSGGSPSGQIYTIGSASLQLCWCFRILWLMSWGTWYIFVCCYAPLHPCCIMLYSSRALYRGRNLYVWTCRFSRYRLWNRTWTQWRAYTLQRRVKTTRKKWADRHGMLTKILHMLSLGFYRRKWKRAAQK